MNCFNFQEIIFNNFKDLVINKSWSENCQFVIHLIKLSVLCNCEIIVSCSKTYFRHILL